MSRSHGFSIVELMVAVCVTAAVAGAALVVVDGTSKAERLSSAYVEDLRGLRRAARLLGDDLRAGRVPAVRYRVERDALLRDDVVVARNVRDFSLDAEGGLTRVHLALGPRTDQPVRRTATLDFVVRRRAEGPR